MSNEKTSWGLGNLLAIIVLAGLVIFGGNLLGNYTSKKQAQKAVAGSEAIFKPVVEKTVSYDGQNNKTALELLRASHEVETQDSSIGVFVTAIDGTKNQDTKYWMLYTDGKLASLGADQYKTKDGEKIEWRYESFQ